MNFLILPRIFLVLLILYSTACDGNRQADKSSDIFASDSIPSVSHPYTVLYFEGTGVEPFWGIKISNTSIEFSEPADTGITRISWSYVKPELAQDSNVKSYRVKSEEGALQIDIYDRICINGMSGDSSDYTLKVSIKKAGERQARDLTGCGNNVTDYRLHDIWALEKMKGKELREEDFLKRRPYMEINTSNMTFMGNADCNSMSGQFFSERDKLRFQNIVSTQMACEEGNLDAEFIDALQASTHYTIGDNRLWLSNVNGQTLVFRHVD